MATSKASKLNVEVSATSAIGNIDRLSAAFTRLQSRVQKTAASFARLGAAGSTAFSKLGRAGASAFRVLSKGFSIVARLARTFINVFKTVLKVVLAAGAGFALFAKSVTETGNQINKFINTLVILKGNVKDAKTELGFLFDMSNKLGTSFTAAATPFTKFAAAAAGTISDQSIRDVFEAFATVGVALQLTKSEVMGVFLALQQIASKGVVSMEELRLQLAERVPGAMRIAASSMGMTMADFEEAVRDRTINAGEFLEKFSAKLKATFGIAAELASVRLFADIQRLGNALTAFKLNTFVSGFESGLKNLVTSATRFLNNNPELAQALGEFSKGIFDNVANFLNTLSADTVISVLNNLISAFETLINTIRDLAFSIRRLFDDDFDNAVSNVESRTAKLEALLRDRQTLRRTAFEGFVLEGFGTSAGDLQAVPANERQIENALERLVGLDNQILTARDSIIEARIAVRDLGLELQALPTEAFERISGSMVGPAVITLGRIEPLPPGAPGTGGQLNLSGQPLGVDAIPPATFAAQEAADKLLDIVMPDFFDELIKGNIRNGMDELLLLTLDLNELTRSQAEDLRAIVEVSAEIQRLRDQPDEIVDAVRLNNLIREQSKETQDFLKLEEKRFELMKDQNDELERRAEIMAKLTTFQKSLEETFISVQDAIFNSIKKTEDAIVSLVATGKADFSSLANSIIADLVRIAVQAFFTRFILGPLLGGLTDALGNRLGGTLATNNSIGGAGSVLDGLFTPIDTGHTGGVVGGDRLQQRSAFDKLRSNEQPIVVERGEGIFTQEQMRALAPISQISSRIPDRPSALTDFKPVINVRSAGTKIEIINQSGGEATVENETQADGTELIKVIIGAVASDIGGDGQISKILKGKFGLRNQTGLR